VGLLDADIHGPSAPILLGLKGVMATTEEHESRRLIKPFTVHGIKAMSECNSAHHIFGKDGAKKEAAEMGVPYLGAAPLDITIRESGDAGVPVAVSDGKIADIFADMAKAVIKG